MRARESVLSGEGPCLLPASGPLHVQLHRDSIDVSDPSKDGPGRSFHDARRLQPARLNGALQHRLHSSPSAAPRTASHRVLLRPATTLPQSGRPRYDPESPGAPGYRARVLHGDIQS